MEAKESKVVVAGMFDCCLLNVDVEVEGGGFVW